MGNSKMSLDESKAIMINFSCLLIKLDLKVKDGYKLLCLSPERFHAFKSGREIIGETHYSLARSLIEHEMQGNLEFIRDELERK